MLIAKYTANASGVLPTFNDGYQYTVNETESNGIHTVELFSDDDFTSCSFDGKSELLTVEYLNVTNNVTTMTYMFRNCSKLTQLDVSNFDTGNVTTMSDMFRSCSQLTQLDLSNWDMKNVTVMNYMFYSAPKLATIGDVSNWDTSKVKEMNYIFSYCSSLTQLDFSNWDTSNVTGMYAMFYMCSNLTQLDLSNWDMNKVTTYRNMFNNTPMLERIIMTNSDYNSINKVIGTLPTRTSGTGCLDVTGVDDISLVDKATLNSKNWILLNIIDTLIAFYTANASGVLPTFNDGYQYTVNETESNGIYTVELYSNTDFTSCSFNGKTELLTVEYLKVTLSVTSITNLFRGCSSLTQLDVSNFNTGNVTDMSYTFNGCVALIRLDLSNFNTDKVTTMRNMFYNCKLLTQLDVSNFNTSKVINMNATFQNCSKLTQLDVSNFNTGAVTNMESLFRGCSSLTQLYLSNFNTSKVQNISFIFENCSALSRLDLSNFITSKVVNTQYMFNYCSNLTQLDLSNFDINKVSNSTNMFQNCPKLQHIGMLYCDNNTVNTIANALPTVSGLTRTIYIQDTKSNIYTPRDSIVFYDYKGSRTTINLPQPLNNGDMLIWDDSLRRYTLNKSDGSAIEIGTNVKYVLDVVGSYYRIETDEKESAPSSMTVKLYISKDVL